MGTPFPSPLRTLALSPALGTTLVRCLGNSGNSFEAGCAIVRPFIGREGVAFADWATVTPSLGALTELECGPSDRGPSFFFFWRINRKY